MKKKTALISDASVLIDIIKADREALRIAAEHFDIFLPYVILQEVSQLDEHSAVELGLKLYEEETKMIADAKKREAGLSFRDIVCLEISRLEGFVCLTNDGGLRSRCIKEKVKCMRGLRMILELVESKKLEKARAMEIADKIRINNTRITAGVINEFLERLEEL